MTTQPITIIAILGNESHTTSSGWAKLEINGKRVSYRDATSSKWLTEYGDKHSSWVECVFQVKEGDKLVWDAGSNHGQRGSIRERQNLTLIARADADVWENETMGGPGREATLKGRLVMMDNPIQNDTDRHARLVESL